MKSKPLHSASKLGTALLFSVAVFILLEPWFSLALRAAVHPDGSGLTAVWAIAVIWAVAWAGKWLARVGKGYRLSFIGAFAGLNAGVTYLFGWPLSVCVPFTLVFVLFGLRYRLYFSTADPKNDVVFGVFILLFNMILTSIAGYPVGITNVVLYFAAAVGVLTFFNLKYLEDRGFDPHYGLAVFLLVVVAVLVFGTAFVVGLPLEAGLIGAVVGGLRRIYLYLAEFIALLLYGLAWVLRPLFALLEGIKISPPEEPPGREPLTSPLDDLTERAAEGGWAGLEIAPYLFWGVLVLFLVVAAIALVRRISSGEGEGPSGEGVSQERESIFSLSVLGSGARKRWHDMRNGFSSYRLSRLSQRYRGRDPLTRVRWAYVRLVLNMGRVAPFGNSDTPLDYLDRIRDRPESAEIRQEIDELTEIYNRAKYGEVADREDAKRAEDLWARASGRLSDG